MSFWNTIRDFLGGYPSAPSKPALRNRAGGMAWINAKIDEGEGSGALVNRVVRTVRIAGEDFWQIDPPQAYVCTALSVNVATGMVGRRGDNMLVTGIRDGALTPIPSIGDGERDESLAWLPPVPTRALQRETP
jgi:hypothetical protein